MNNSSGFPDNFESEDVSKILEEMFPRYYMRSDITASNSLLHNIVLTLVNYLSIYRSDWTTSTFLWKSIFTLQQLLQGLFELYFLIYNLYPLNTGDWYSVHILLLVDCTHEYIFSWCSWDCEAFTSRIINKCWRNFSMYNYMYTYMVWSKHWTCQTYHVHLSSRLSVPGHFRITWRSWSVISSS